MVDGDELTLTLTLTLSLTLTLTRLVDGDERAALLRHSVSQHGMWHGCAQSTAGYVQGVSTVCHSSSAGNGPCLKRILTVFGLPADHPLAGLTAVQRLMRIGIKVLAL